jgi:hypothetical protein
MGGQGFVGLELFLSNKLLISLDAMVHIQKIMNP